VRGSRALVAVKTVIRENGHFVTRGLGITGLGITGLGITGLGQPIFWCQSISNFFACLHIFSYILGISVFFVV
jgi:hypothetical protein